jgi:hypothetical protein
LFKNSGKILLLDEEEKKELQDYIKRFIVSKSLRVSNQTYEVENSYFSGKGTTELANTASSYFNTKINVSNVEERILAYLLSGLTLRDIQKSVRDKSISGFHPDINSKALASFEYKWGRTPDVVQLSHPDSMGNVKGYMSAPKVYTKCGEKVEMDYFECDFNEREIEDPTGEENGVKRKRVKKLSTHG